MKIYPSLHDIKEVEYDKVNAADIPLACINIDNSDFNYYVSKENTFTDNDETIVKPYDKFDTNKINFYNDANVITQIDLKEDTNSKEFLYIPQSSKEFVPLAFSYQILVKKAMQYSSNNIYDLAIAGSGSSSFLEGLMPLFGDAPLRGLCPANISVNSQNQQLSSIWKSTYKDQDFLFIETTDGISYVDNGTTSKIDAETILANNTNIWLCVDTFDKTMINKTVSNFTYNNNILYNNQNYNIVNYDKVFDLTIENNNYPLSNYKYINLFKDDCPVLIIKKENSGFIIVSTKSFMSTNNSKLIYEIMMFITLNGYKKTNEKLTWITDEPVDYLFSTEIFNKKHPNINLNYLLQNNRYDIGNAFKIIEVTTNNTNVVLDQINYNNDIFFKKIGTQTDPVKEDGSISVYTTKHSVLIYKNVVIKKIETNLNINTEITDDGHFIIIGACKSSSRMINTTAEQKLQIKNIDRAFYITFNTSFMLVDYAQYNAASDGVKIAYVTPVHKINVTKYDARIIGGGLPESEDDNYNLADISNREGRPIRRGFSTVIRLPKKFQIYEDRIRTEVSRHGASGEFIAIVFEDR